jgi:hypothetical protein
VTKGFTDIEPVDASWERVQTKNDVHAILLDGVVGDRSQVLLLVTVVQHRSGNIDPSGVGGGDSKSVDANRGELVNIGGGNESRVVVFQNFATRFLSDSLAESPLIRDTGSSTIGEEIRGQGVFNSQPGAYQRQNLSNRSHTSCIRWLTNVRTMRLVSVPSLELLPVHLV